jgi:two-component system, OmpR family, sensor histidine kinase VicK
MNFAVSSKELCITIDEMKGGQIAKNLLISNEPPYIRHYNSIFEDLWNKSVSAEQKIKEIEEGIILGRTEVIQSPKDIQQLFIDMVKAAKNEVLLVLPTINAFYREERIGIIELLKQSAEREHRVNVRILTPTNDTIEEKLQNIVSGSEQGHSKGEEERREQQHQMKNKTKKSFDIRHIDVGSSNEDETEALTVAAETSAVTTVTIVIVDKKESLVIEKIDDSKQNFIEAVGVATYSNSKPTVLSYVSIFENLWKQTELYQQLKESTKQLELAYEQLKISDNMQKEFINIAAHELRTPIQPILGLTQIIYSNIDKDGSSPYEKRKQKEMLEVVTRNANRLQRLSEDILDVTRIESQNLNLKLERLNLDEIISNAINDAKRSYQLKKNVSLLYQHDKYNTVFVHADKARLNQVLSNLISNAIRFTKEGSIIITQKKQENENKVIVSVKDSGTGIDPEVLPRLFQKFATKSYQGTGLGLYISKSIVEAHGGKMWAENNSGGKGSTFYFTLPVI